MRDPNGSQKDYASLMLNEPTSISKWESGWTHGAYDPIQLEQSWEFKWDLLLPRLPPAR